MGIILWEKLGYMVLVVGDGGAHGSLLNPEIPAVGPPGKWEPLPRPVVSGLGLPVATCCPTLAAEGLPGPSDWDDPGLRGAYLEGWGWSGGRWVERMVLPAWRNETGLAVCWPGGVVVWWAGLTW